MTSEIRVEDSAVVDALAQAGCRESVRRELFDVLRRAEIQSDEPAKFRELVRWPLIVALLRDTGRHQVALANGLIFEVGPDSRIEKALLLSTVVHPDHVWEPQTTRLLVALAGGAKHAVVGGAYIGDQVLPIAREMGPNGIVHAFEPMGDAFARLVRNLAINQVGNVEANQLGLWDESEVQLELSGDLALASSAKASAQGNGSGEAVQSTTVMRYLAARGIDSIDLIMLDTEGGEERALRGAESLLGQPVGTAPNVVFEIHRDYVDWSSGLEKTPVVELLVGHGYEVFAVRDIHGNHPMGDQPVEVVPVATTYLEGPSHGFNMLAIKDPQLIGRLGLEVVEGVSPKLIPDKDPALHHPRSGFGV